MAFDAELADRVRPILTRRKGFAEKRMFGGVGFLLNGNMCVGVWKEFLIVRVGREHHEDVLAEPDTREFDITGRAMKGWAMVEPAGVRKDESLRGWVRRAAIFAETLPAK